MVRLQGWQLGWDKERSTGFNNMEAIDWLGRWSSSEVKLSAEAGGVG